MKSERLQEIKDKVDEAKLEVGSREYPSLSWLGWVVAYVPELIAAVEQAQAELADMEVERIALEHGAAHVESELTKQLEQTQAEVERLLKVAKMYDSHKPFLRVHGFSAEELDV